MDDVVFHEINFHYTVETLHFAWIYTKLSVKTIRLWGKQWTFELRIDSAWEAESIYKNESVNSIKAVTQCKSHLTVLTALYFDST